MELGTVWQSAVLSSLGSKEEDISNWFSEKEQAEKV